MDVLTRRRAAPEGGKAPWVRLGALIAVLWTALAGAVLAAAALDAARARDRVEAVADAMSSLRLDGSAEQLRESAELFETAARRTEGAVLAPLRLLPPLRHQLTSFRTLARGAARAASVSADALEETSTAVDDLPAPARRAELAARLADVAERAGRGLDGLDLGSRGWLLPPLAAQHDRFAEEVTRLRQASARAALAARGLSAVLDGPRRYLVLAGHNGEMRAGMGTFLVAGDVTLRDGRIAVGALEPTAFLPRPSSPLPLDGDLERNWGWLRPDSEWRNLGASPRFDVTADLAARMWRSIGRGQVDGVLAVDVVGMRLLAEATGPVMVNGRRLDADALESHLLREQYADFPRHGRQQERRENLIDIARQLLEATSDAEPLRLAAALARAAAGRHLLAWSPRPADQRTWQAAGVHGVPDDDSLMVALLNRGGNKLDQFVHASADLSCTPASRLSACRLVVSLRNRTPRGEPPYVAGPHPDVRAAPGEYVGLVAVTLPAGNGGVAVGGTPRLAAKGPDGPGRVVAWEVRLPRGGSARFAVRFAVPPATTAITVEPSARLPAVDWRAGWNRWTDVRPRTVRVSD